MNSPLTRYAFLAGVAYFCCMSLAHFFGMKQPLLFVYYDTPFHAYQDKIISFAVTAYIALFWLASKSREAVPAALIVMALTVLGLASVNMSDALASVLTEGQSTLPYWIQTILIGAYLIVLTDLWRRDVR
ncbi:hypothetical protein NNA36_02515 [Shimia sp. CNT1-13L.2]|uniref:hypothetical protein n=1 Tax=Shimia sp. CNT1-13L.2 TaxID=2959663 RepID=UPI0020CF2FFC|nr:hypothetical protein [Shimia sp. CNT1-13L.2]MCP9480827.1 hypothetical protein [Shimia sp. CNT1-13L.2]